MFLNCYSLNYIGRFYERLGESEVGRPICYGFGAYGSAQFFTRESYNYGLSQEGGRETIGDLMDESETHVFIPSEDQEAQQITIREEDPNEGEVV